MNKPEFSDHDIYNEIYSLPTEKTDKIKTYESLYLSAPFLIDRGISMAHKDRKRPILLLAGTSIPIPDRVGLMKYLLGAGYELATVSNDMGRFFDMGINPNKERVDALRDYLDHLKNIVKVDGVDVVAQSYSAFEIIRVLIENPEQYQSFIKSIVLINPPGFDDNIGLFSHCSRFVFMHVLKGIIKSLAQMSTMQQMNFAKMEAIGIVVWTYKTIKNPVRTLREVLDIVSYKVKEPLHLLSTEYHYDINLFLQTGDQILPYQIALKQASDILPQGNIKVVPGGHNDVFIQEWQRGTLLEFIRSIRARRE